MKQYIVDAFTDEVFHGNQAAICILDQWLPDVAASSIAECPEIKYFWQERLPCFPNVNYIFR